MMGAPTVRKTAASVFYFLPPSYYLLLRCQRKNGRKKCGLRGLIVRQWTHFNPLHNGEEEEEEEGNRERER